MRKVLILLLLLCPTSVLAADRAVPGTYATINAALAAAGSGDRIMVAVGTYTECVTLPNKGTLASPIIIRSAASDGNLPATNVRIGPAYSAYVASITAGVGCSAFETAVGASDYQIGPGIKVTDTQNGQYPAFEIGRNNSSQMLEADQPENITIDRVWISPNQWMGLKSGVDANGKNITVKNSYIEKITGVTQDAVGVRCFNGDGPLTVYNNYISAAGEGMICGGDQPYMMTFADVNSGATTTTATLSNFINRISGAHTIATLRVGQYVSVLASGGTIRYHPKVLTCGTKKVQGEVCDGNTITYETIPVAPDTGTASDIQWGSIPTDVSIRRNYFWKDPDWRNDIMATPVISSATPSTSAGTLVAGTYYYKVQATYIGYSTSRVYSGASAQVSAILTGTGQVTVAWGAVSGATNITYRVFRSTVSGTFAGYIDVGNVTSYVDTGLGLTGTSAPPSGTNWQVKNSMEMKFANRVQIDSNIFKHSFPGADQGYAIWIKSNNYGSGNYMFTRDLVFEKNVIDSVGGCFSILGRVDSTGPTFTRPLENITIRNNICLDSNTNWMQGKASTYAIKTQSPIINLTIENNTIQHTMQGLLYLTKTSRALSSPFITNFIFRNNIARKENYSVFSGSCSQGNITECFTESVDGTNNTFVGNVLGGSVGTTPPGNIVAPYTEYEGSTHFTSYSHTGGVIGDFLLKSGSSWKGTASGGGDPGANISLITTATTGVTTGALEGTGGSAPPNITTSSPLTSVVQNAAMSSQCIAATDGTAPYTWSVVAPTTLPAGTAINSSSGCITGTPTTAGTYNFNIRVVDSTATPLSDTQAFQWTITPASATLTITTTTLDSVQLSQVISKQILATGGTPPYSFSVNTGSSLPSWLTLSTSGLLEGTAAATGTFNFTLRVDDAAAGNDTQALSQVVAAETQTCGRSGLFRLGGITVQRAFFRGPTEPSVSSPTCARKDDSWFDTSTNTRKIAKLDELGALVWALDTGDAGGVNTVVLDTAAAPTLNSLITGTENGTWTITDLASLSGIDASSITRGIIDPARLPQSSSSTESVSLTGNVSTTSASLTNMTGMSWSVAANTNYEIHCTFGLTTTDNANGFLISWTGPSSPVFTGAVLSAAGSSAGTPNGTALVGNDSGGTLPNSLTTSTAVLRGVWRNGANSGTLQIRFKSETATTETITILSGSVCRYEVF